MTLRDFLAWANYRVTFCQAPNPAARKALDRLLAQREDVPKEEWRARFTRGAESSAACDLLYEFFTGLQRIPFGRIRPEDRLREDLRLGEALWNDWEDSLYDEFESRFRKDLLLWDPRGPLVTVQDLIAWLEDGKRNAPPSSWWGPFHTSTIKALFAKKARAGNK